MIKIIYLYTKQLKDALGIRSIIFYTCVKAGSYSVGFIKPKISID